MISWSPYYFLSSLNIKWQKILMFTTLVHKMTRENCWIRYAASRFRLRVWLGPVAHSPFPHDTPSPRHTNESTPTRLGFVPLGLNCCQKREGLTNLPPTAGSTPCISITTRSPLALPVLASAAERGAVDTHSTWAQTLCAIYIPLQHDGMFESQTFRIPVYTKVRVSFNATSNRIL